MAWSGKSKGHLTRSGGRAVCRACFWPFWLDRPKPIMDLGLLLFVYAVGLQAGMRFFRTFRRQGIQFIAIGFVTVVAGAITVGLVAKESELPLIWPPVFTPAR